MEWKLDDSRPIWMQLEEQLTRRILSGWYKAGEKLPTVRDLAAEAGVNPNTMQRALAALDGEGLSIPNRTIGRTVTEDEGVLEAMRSRLAGNIIDQFCWSCLKIFMRILTGHGRKRCVRNWELIRS